MASKTRAADAVAGTRRGAADTDAATTGSAKPTNTAASRLPQLTDWKLLGPNQSVSWLNAEKFKGDNLNLKTIKVAAFDMDDTLITPNGTHVFAKNENDWRWLCPQVVPKLKEVCDQGFAVIIISNQAGVKDDPVKRRQLQTKINLLNANSQGVPISAIFAHFDDIYRKPSTKMWETIEEEFRNDGVLDRKSGKIDMTQSFYCGDAAGRNEPTLAGRKKDFSCGDRKLAYNLGIKFYTPEEFFLGNKTVQKFDWDGMSPEHIKVLQTSANNAKNNALNLLPADRSALDVVLMVGFPGSGKSSVYRNHFAAAGYVHINRDTLKTPAKCLAAAEDALKNKKSIVIDNTNPAAADRLQYLQLAKKYNAKSIRALVMESDEDLAQHLAKFREFYCNGDHIPGMVYPMYKKKYEEPTTAEGFTQIVKVPVVLDLSNYTEEQKKALFSLS